MLDSETGSAGESDVPGEIATAQFALTKEEFVPAFRLVLRRQKLYKHGPFFSYGASLLFVVGGALLLASHVRSEDFRLFFGLIALVPFGLILLVCLIMEAQRYWGPSRIWASEPGWQAEHVIRFTQDGIDSVGKSSRGFMAWSSIGGVETLGDVYLFTNESGRYLASVPRRAFTTEADELAFGSLVSGLISPSNVRMPGSTQHG
jgi:hypothetical protein